MKAAADRPGSIGGFVLRFAAVYLLLLSPWPGCGRIYVSAIRWTCARLAECAPSRWWIQVEVLHPTAVRPLDTRIIVADRSRSAPDGRARALVFDLDVRAIGWIPTALALALFLAPSAPWRRRLVGLCAGLSALQLLIVLALAAHVAGHAIARWQVPPHAAPAIAVSIFRLADESFIMQLGPGLSLAAACWLVCGVVPAFSATSGLRGRDIAATAAKLV